MHDRKLRNPVGDKQTSMRLKEPFVKFFVVVFRTYALARNMFFTVKKRS